MAGAWHTAAVAWCCVHFHCMSAAPIVQEKPPRRRVLVADARAMLGHVFAKYLLTIISGRSVPTLGSGLPHCQSTLMVQGVRAGPALVNHESRPVVVGKRYTFTLVQMNGEKRIA